MTLAILAGLVIAAIAAVLAMRAAAAEASREARRVVDHARGEAAAAVKAAELEGAAIRKAAEAAAREESLAVRTRADEELARSETTVLARMEAASTRETELAVQDDAIAQQEAQIDALNREVQSRRDRASGIERDAQKKLATRRSELEARAGVTAQELIARLGKAWLDDARARAAAMVRAVDQTAADPAHEREAKRVMEIAATRYHHHYLTERAMNNLRVGKDLVALLLDREGAMHKALERVSGLQLLVNDDRDAIRLDGLDGVGKEMVRRALGRLVKKPETIDQAKQDPDAWATRTREHLEQEIRALGKRAFQTLGIPKAHPEIVDLVGALNYRTSYTQNQWWHAVEASYLAGMMAAELGLDAQLARRATLMHDIGKALTHKIEGSHAVIGADIARRLGEPEVVANAIGAHHADEPCNSVYAYLVAASDAMSGARPGARRELAEGFTAKVEDLERIGMRPRGVIDAHAVHGGRELRVYVREREVDDLRVVEMSTEIANQIAEEMTFPGQIKVTVIRAFEATATAN
ncbi:MAG TPA: Rnase Y domain-containing protein [Xanthomonadales bacterium]|nr:Rnase Y domain-containing protein [Xanthomonadales bacterium]